MREYSKIFTILLGNNFKKLHFYKGKSLQSLTRDIKDLVAKGVLEPQQGRMRDVFYGIRCDEATLLVPRPREDED